MMKRSGAAILSLVIVFVLAMPVEALSWREFFSGSDIEHIDNDPEGLPACQSAVSTGGPAVGVSGGTVPTNFSLGPLNDGAQRRVNLMKALMADFGLTPAQAAGPVGNFAHESGGSNLPPDVNERLAGQGGGSGPPRRVIAGTNTGGYGWAQWTGSRKTAMVENAIKGGYMASWSVNGTDGANYAYLKKELSEGYKTTISRLKATATPEDAAVSFESTYEKAGKPALTPRKKYARQAFDEYTRANGGAAAPVEGVPGATPASATSCGPDTASPGPVSANGTAFPLIGGKAVVKNPGIFRNSTTDRAGHPYIAYDILANPGTPVAAYTDGTVNMVGNDRCGGRMITAYNKQQDITYSYMHMALNSEVAKGATITPGQRIGVVGSAANGCGTPHIHIDAIKGSARLGCSRISCASSTKALFTDIGPQLFTNFQALP